MYTFLFQVSRYLEINFYGVFMEEIISLEFAKHYCHIGYVLRKHQEPDTLCYRTHL